MVDRSENLDNHAQTIETNIKKSDEMTGLVLRCFSIVKPLLADQSSVRLRNGFSFVTQFTDDPSTTIVSLKRWIEDKPVSLSNLKNLSTFN